MKGYCIVIEPDQVTSHSVRQLARYWHGKQAGGTPSRSAIDPLEIPRLLPYLVIAQIERDPLRVRYRLVGTQVVQSHGADFTNRYLDECNFLIETELLACYARIAGGCGPVYLYFEWLRDDRPYDRGRVGACESGFFPLSSDGAMVDMVLSIADPGVPLRPRTDLA